MNGFLYTLTLEEPVLANSLGGEPNSAISLFYIPGGALRGAAIQAYTGKKDAADETFRCLFLNGDTRYLNAYPMLDDRRALPIPVKFRKPKYFHSSDFGEIKAGAIYALDDVKQINVHTQRDAERGHATAQAGAVYRYIALPAGMRLQGVVLTQNEADAKTLQDLLKGKSVLLGKARTAGYGLVNVETTPLTANWRESGTAPIVPSASFSLTLLSPALVRDENGQFSLDIQPALEARLGVKPVIQEIYCKPEIIGGFNRTWGLPLPQMTAIAAGSVFVVKADVPVEKLNLLEETGIGERRAEGFGRVAVNLALPDKAQWESVDLQRLDFSAGSLSANDPVAELMLKRILRRDLDEKVLHFSREATKNYNGAVPNSQLSRWRVLLRDSLENKGIPRMLTFCQESKGKPGWKKMEKARIEFDGQRPRLTEWIESVLEQPESLGPVWGAGFKPERSLGSTSIKLDDALNAEYRLRLLDAVLAVMATKKAKGGAND